MAFEVRAEVTLESLLNEMTDCAAVARWPQPVYQSLQASSYNRASTNRTQPNQNTRGWFADSDGTGFLRTETIRGRTEWVLLEHAGPGCITKLWTPFFYYGFDNRVGPNLRLYLDGAATPVLDESLIKLVRGEGAFRPPLAMPTARAGNSYAPIPFARSCKITMTGKPFYYLINYRAYAEGTPVESFTRAGYAAAAAAVAKAGQALTAPPDAGQGAIQQSADLKPGGQLEVKLPDGPSAVRQFTVRLPRAVSQDACLRSTVLAMTFDGEETVWCPLGDFFCSADSLHPIRTWPRTVAADGTMVCRWVMPYRRAAVVRVLNLGALPVPIEFQADVARWDWDDRSLHFHANWRPDDVVPGTPFQDWNFLDVRGQGVFVGDAWTVLNIQGSWWGEGDEKIYVDGAWDKGFPTHFGTGTEDYYGWAGGEVPTRADEFSVPFLANARVGGLDGRTTGYNICTRTRSLDAIPFQNRFVFDMESSFGTDIRQPWNLLGYSAVTFWYAKPGATHNRPGRPDAAARPILSVAEVKAKSDAIRKAVRNVRSVGPGGYEFERLKPTAMSPGLEAGPQRPAETFHPSQWSGEAHCFIPARKAGDFIEFTFTEQFSAKTLVLNLTTSFDFGVATISVNGKPAAAKVDLFSPEPTVKAIHLGRHMPVDNRFVLRCELVEPNARSRGAKTFMGLDSLVLQEDVTPKPAVPTSGSPGAGVVTLKSLLAEMTDCAAVARWPQPEFTCKQASSYDRGTVAPDKPGWFANSDQNQFIRVETNQGRTEKVMMDAEGPGCIVRIWLTTDRNKKGTMRFYLDGTEEPALVFPAYDLLSGDLKIDPPLAQPHPGYRPDANGGNNFYLPILYAKHCKITWEEAGQSSRYYQINYRTYAPGTAVQTFTRAALEAARPALERVNKALSAPPDEPQGQTLATEKEIVAGGEHSLDLPSGPSAVRRLGLRVPTGQSERALRSLLVQMEFDGERTVWCPSSDFFGSGVGLSRVESWYRTVDTNGTMTCRWVMPYQKTAKLTLLNLAEQPIKVSLRATVSPWTWDDRSMHFHAVWQHESGLKTPPHRDWNFVKLAGRGVYVGDTLALFNPIATWYGEGDEKIWVDGEAFPSHVGTGTEDYYGYSYAPKPVHHTPFCGQPRIDQPMTQGHSTSVRTRNLDGIPFRRSLQFDIELISWAPTTLTYAATTFWYAFPGTTSNVQPQPSEATAHIPTLAEAQAARAKRIPGAIECETLKIVAKSEGLPAEPQDMSPWDNARWSKGHHLVMKPKEPGMFVELEIPAPDAQPRQLVLYATQAPDFGILRFTINDQASTTTLDCWGSQVQPAEPVRLGVFAPKDGRFLLRAEVTGANPKTKGARIFFGLDCLVLEMPFPEWGLGPFGKHPLPVLSLDAASRFTCPVLGKEVRWEAQNVYNPAAVVRDGKVSIFYRADDRNPALKWGRTCRIGMAWSEDGTNFTRHPTPVVFPDNDEWKKYEWEGGCEDLHIVEDESGTAYMNYTTWNGRSDTVSVATSRDLIQWKKHGPAFAKAGKTDGRSGVVVSKLVGDRLIAAKVNGKYWMYYTHSCALAWSTNLIDWTPTGHSVWPGGGREAGAIALLRDDGILLMTQGGHHRLGAWVLRQALIDRHDLKTVLKEQKEPFLWPELDWEEKGFTGNTTVANTLVPFKGKWWLYYGGADRVIGLAVSPFKEP